MASVISIATNVIAADTRAAASASYSDVNAAVAAAQPGDTVVVPPGQATWASQLIITKSLSLIGAGAGSTVITSGIGNLNAYLIVYRPTDFASNPAFRVSGFTFNVANSSHGVFLDGTRNTTSVLQNRIRIDHNTFTGAPNHALGPQAIHIGGIMGVVDNNLFDNFGYPIRNCWGPSAQSSIWWNNWNANLLGTSENMYFEDNTFTGVEIIMDCQYGNRYAFRYNTVTTWTASFPLLDIHGNHSAGDQYSSFGGEVYGNQLNDTSGMRLMDHRGGKLLLFMNNSTTPSWHIQVRDEAPDSSNPTTNPEPQYPNDSYFFLNRRNLTGSAPTIVNEGPWSDNPPLYGVPQENREFWNGNPSFNGTVGVGWGTLANRPTTCTVGVGYWATNQSTTNLSGMVGKNPTTPILGTLYVCTATNVWTAFYTPYTYPHPMRKTALTVTSPNGGEAWAIGSSQKITWTSTADIGNVKIEYSTDNGANYTTITSSTADTWSYNWTVPNVISSSCRVRVSAAGTGPADTSDSEFTIVQSPPVKIRLSRSRLTFAATTGGKQTPDQFVLINNIGQGTMHWTAEEAEPGGMLRISPTQGTGNGKILVGVNPEGFSPGLYTGYIRVSDSLASNSPQTVSITLNVHDSEMTSSPFGTFETPVEGSTVRGAVPVTGWALDDIGVTAVKIYRDPLPGEQDTWNGLSYVGDATLTEGARPDIASIFPDLPQNYKAGWGYMMLTNFLPPSGGNGEYVIHAIAFDSEGNAVRLGTKTLYCDNLHAVAPFGTIDTPTQGGSASGLSSINFGWALTPLPNLIPPDGSTITVWVDGLPLGHPLYGSYRADIASLFPGLANSSGASGAFVLDTTRYENGIHTIAWSVVDSAGNAEGIGSRYFEIFNTGVTSSPASVSLAPLRETSPSPEATCDPLIPIQTVAVRMGFRTDSEWNYFQPDGSGTIHLEMGEVDRLEIFFRKARSLNGGLFVGGELHPLPIGSTLREAQGVFAWTPGPGFLGTFELVFFVDDGQEGIARIPITVTIKPKFDRF